ncbi:pentatricopeptide repeat-containing protein [Corchorus olitorius]|uniref:Pentatricopeptide repeat-containing protein n=1 Tax=Corchorus olitorius TaxID=93759 RepID=A0A1R3G533_9ROSI|nr:pentatricopeptide repeat-containing protein [Corchorus olitorius]
MKPAHSGFALLNLPRPNLASALSNTAAKLNSNHNLVAFDLSNEAWSNHTSHFQKPQRSRHRR